MKILILSNSNPYNNAGVVAKDVLRSLRKIDSNEVKLVVREWGHYSDKDIHPIDNYFLYNLKKLRKKISNQINRLALFREKPTNTNRKYHLLDYDQTISYFSSRKILKKAGFKPDAILVLFMQQFLSFGNLYELNSITKAPIFLCLMDMAAMTGGCHYAWECKGYENACGCCPALFSNNPFDQSKTNWKFKKELVDLANIQAIACSEETFLQLQNSSIFAKNKKHKFLIYTDKKSFKPSEKLSTRKGVGLPIKKNILLFGAVSIEDRRKGFKELLIALNTLSHILNAKERNNIHLAIVGNIPIELTLDLPFPFTILGYLCQDDLPKAFQSADVFISPSIEDSGPMMINQSLACGTPVVSFEVGVALDLIHNGKTGYIAKKNDPEDLAIGINSILSLKDKAYKKMSKACRNLDYQTLGSIEFNTRIKREINAN